LRAQLHAAGRPHPIYATGALLQKLLGLNSRAAAPYLRASRALCLALRVVRVGRSNLLELLNGNIRSAATLRDGNGRTWLVVDIRRAESMG
jgi:hypothetical protein